MIVGYARVSTDGQTLDAQQAALRGAGAERVFAEKVSGAVTDRKALARCAGCAGPRRRSARNEARSACAKHAGFFFFRSQGDPWADTTTPHGKLMITVLGGSWLSLNAT